MPLKTVLILANSVRHWPNACVAGREVVEQVGQRSFGAWVRPVSAHGEGELSLEGLTIELSSEHYPERTRKQRRALFRYQARHYNLAITDPTIEARYGLQVPTPSEPALMHRIEHRCFVCVSLAHQPFRGHHYKLAAAIIDPEHI